MWPLFCLFMVVRYGMACDRSLGPSGKVECIMIPRYNNQWQWATCLTDAYMQQKSSHQHQCIDRTTTYCWYQCMLEVNDKNNGPVTKDCSCSPSQTTVSPPISPTNVLPSTYYNPSGTPFPPISPTTSLKPECYSPTGKSCDWYRNCLERKYPCEPTSNAYAIAYAEKFCRLYGDSQHQFSDKGRKWIDGVRKCLQVSLVPLLRPWSKPTCKQIREKAFESHVPCYLKPDKDVPSICDLECAEYFKIFFVIKGAFLNYDTAWESMKGMWNIGKKCGVRCSKTWFQEKGREAMKAARMTIQRFKQQNWHYSDPLPEADARSRFAYRLGSAIASSMSWNKDVMDWLSYPGNITACNTESNIFDIFIVLADIKGLRIPSKPKERIDENGNIKKKEDLDSTIRSLAVAIKEGKLPLQVDGYNVWLKSIDSCSDQSCEQAQTLASSYIPPNWNNGEANVSKNPLELFGLAAIACMLIIKP